MHDPIPFVTLGDIRRELSADDPSVTEARLKYAVLSYDIAPRMRAGVIRLWGRDQSP